MLGVFYELVFGTYLGRIVCPHFMGIGGVWERLWLGGV